MDKITQILENVVRCKYFGAGDHIKNPIKNSYQDGLGRTTQTLDHVVVVHMLISDKRKSQINKYSDNNSQRRKIGNQTSMQKIDHFISNIFSLVTMITKGDTNPSRKERAPRNFGLF